MAAVLAALGVTCCSIVELMYTLGAMKTNPPITVSYENTVQPSALHSSQAIGIFDSGVGGLTVARSIASRLPHESMVYMGDTARCPYGPRDPSEVCEFVREICAWLETRTVKLIVIACNTATAAGLTLAQREFDVPVLGVIGPGARAAVHVTRSRRVGVIGTVSTIESKAYPQAIRAIDAGIKVYSAATPRFVDIVERGLLIDDGASDDMLADALSAFDAPELKGVANEYLTPLKRRDIDTLVLGCTHFPLIAPLIGEVMGSGTQLISSADETACDVFETLARRGQLADATEEPRYEMATTSEDVAEFTRLATLILGRSVSTASHVHAAELAELAAMHHRRRSR